MDQQTLMYLGGGVAAIYTIKELGSFTLALVDKVKGKPRVNGAANGCVHCPHADAHTDALKELVNHSERVTQMWMSPGAGAHKQTQTLNVLDTVADTMKEQTKVASRQHDLLHSIKEQCSVMLAKMK